jgi:hypothetical protein
MDLTKLEMECKKGIKRQVLLSFLTDPYHAFDVVAQITRKVLELFLKYSVPTAILTKGGRRCLRDLDLFEKMNPLVKVGASLTSDNQKDSHIWERGAALPNDRLDTLKELHAHGITTWVSIEPVVSPDQSIGLMEQSFAYVDHYKVGKMNHQKTDTVDWTQFLLRAVTLLRLAGKRFYVKNDLAAFAPHGFVFTPEERDSDFLSVTHQKETQPLLL